MRGIWYTTSNQLVPGASFRKLRGSAGRSILSAERTCELSRWRQTTLVASSECLLLGGGRRLVRCSRRARVRRSKLEIATHESARYPRHRFPVEIISHAVWLYHVFGFRLRDVELMLAERDPGQRRERAKKRCGSRGATPRRPGVLGRLRRR